MEQMAEKNIQNMEILLTQIIIKSKNCKKRNCILYEVQIILVGQCIIPRFAY